MKNLIKKSLVSSVLVASFAVPTFASAAEQPPNEGPDFTGYEYIHSTDTTGVDIKWTHIYTNSTSNATAVSYTVNRDVYSNANVSVAESFNSMVSKVGMSSEINWGGSTTKSTTVTWNVPAKTTYELKIGSRYAKASGKENRWSLGRLISTKSVNGQWTYQSYSGSSIR